MKKILINDKQWQTRIAILDEDILQNIYLDTPTENSLERCFFKGTVTRILPGIQTAFIDIGQERSGFLHISEIDRQTALKRMGISVDEAEEEDLLEDDERESTEDQDSEEMHQPHNTPRGKQIERILTEGQSVLVQVIKEPIGQKGAKLSTCYTLPGRYLVLMPNINRIGISKKIDRKEERVRLRSLLKKHLPDGMGAIIRTTCDDQTEQEILQDLQYLVKRWQQVLENYNSAANSTRIYQDIDLTLQIIRDHLDKDVELIACDSKHAHNKIKDFLEECAPEYALHLVRYEGYPSLFKKHNVERQLHAALNKKVSLPSGGSIIIESTEAMTVVDVNTGRYTGKNNLEETILKINLEAASEVVRQLRLRNIGGLIVIDFIDMGSAGNRQKLFRFLEKTLKERDKFQSVVLRVSEFGLVQMTRKRSGKTLSQMIMAACTTCHGSGVVLSEKSQTYKILNALWDTASLNENRRLVLSMRSKIFQYVLENHYSSLLDIEKNFSCSITLATLTEGEELDQEYNILVN